MSETQVLNMKDEIATEKPGFFKRILWVFTSPGKLMASLAEKPRVLFWFIAGILAIDVLYLVRLPLYKDFLRESTLKSSEYMESLGVVMTPEMVEASLPNAMVTGLISTPITLAVVYLFITLVFFAILKLMGGQGKFKAYLSVLVHANIISVLYTLLLIPISFISGSLHQGAAPLTSLAALVSQDTTNTLLYGVLASLDIFSIWYYVVLAIGLTAVSKLKKNYVYYVVAGIFIVSMIIGIIGMSAAKALM